METQTRQPTEEQERTNINRVFPDRQVPFGKMTHNLKLEEVLRHCAFNAEKTNPQYEARTIRNYILKKVASVVLPSTILPSLLSGTIIGFARLNGNYDSAIEKVILEGIYGTSGLVGGAFLLADYIGPKSEFAYFGNGHIGYGVKDLFKVYRAWKKIDKMQESGEIRKGNGIKNISDKDLYQYDDWSGA